MRDPVGHLVYVDKRIAEISASLAAVDAMLEKRCNARYEHPSTFRDAQPNAAEQLWLGRAQKLVTEQRRWYNERKKVERCVAAAVAKASIQTGQTPGRSARTLDAVSEEALYAVRLLEGEASAAECKRPHRAWLRTDSRRPICLCGRCSACLAADDQSTRDAWAADDQSTRDAWATLLACPASNDCVRGPNVYRRTQADFAESMQAMHEQVGCLEEPPNSNILRSIDGSPWCEVEKSEETPTTEHAAGPGSLVFRRRSFKGSLGAVTKRAM